MATTNVTPAAAAPAQIDPAPGSSRRLGRVSPRLVIGVVLLLGPLVASLIARLFIGAHGTQIFAYGVSQSPTSKHLLGTDASGRDVLTTLIYSTAPTFLMALVAGVGATLLGTAVGLVAGYLRGLPDALLRGVTDVLLAIPAFSMLILIAALLGNLSVLGLGLVIAAFSWPLVARAVRSQILSLRESPYVTVARLSARSAPAIMVCELLPNMLAFVFAMFLGAVSGALAIAIGLQLIGLGPLTTQTLGLILENAVSNGALSQGLWWWWAPPAAVLVMFFLGLFLLTLAFDEIANPRLRGARG
jgi:peptide/nickel transport system permease protein